MIFFGIDVVEERISQGKNDDDVKTTIMITRTRRKRRRIQKGGKEVVFVRKKGDTVVSCTWGA